MNYVAVGSMVCLMGMVLGRIIMMKRRGVQAFVFAKTHRSDLFLPPIVFFFLYHLVAYTFALPRIEMPFLFTGFEWVGMVCCIVAVCLFLWGLISFGISFRVGIDDETPGNLVTTGAFSYSRNPLYVAFAFELLGFFFTYPNIIFLFALIGGCCLFHRQILREEIFLKQVYGAEYEWYCKRVRRYL